MNTGPLGWSNSYHQFLLFTSMRPHHAVVDSSAPDLDHLRDEAAECRACPLWANATQTVFGEGAAHAQVMFVGEQPGDEEDKAGRPFVGPAGRVLDEAMERAGIDRNSVYVTNAVKHFKWEPRGKRRMHKTPAQQEIADNQDPDWRLMRWHWAVVARSIIGWSREWGSAVAPRRGSGVRSSHGKFSVLSVFTPM